MAIMALEHIVGNKEPYFSALHRGYQWMKATQLEDGGWPTLSSSASDIAPACLFSFAACRTQNDLGKQLVDSALSWIAQSGLPEHEWESGERWCSYETFDERPDEWPRRKYLVLPYAVAATYCRAEGIPNRDKLLRILLQHQEQSGRWTLPSEAGEATYTWYTYVTAFILASIPAETRTWLNQHLRKTLRTASAKDRMFAVVVGVNEYQDERVGKLSCAHNDESAICHWLQQGFPANRIHIHRPSSPHSDPMRTRAGILGAIGRVSRLLADKGPSTLFFYFSGHGRRFGSKDYLLPSDFTFDDPEDTAIAIDDLVGKLRASGARRSLLIVDACRDETSKGLGLYIQNLFGRSRSPSQNCIATLLSCTVGEVSSEVPQAEYLEFKGLSVFTLAFLRTMTPQAQRRREVSLRFVVERLPKEVETLACMYGKTMQRPQINVENATVLDDTFLPVLHARRPVQERNA